MQVTVRPSTGIALVDSNVIYRFNMELCATIAVDVSTSLSVKLVLLTAQ